MSERDFTAEETVLETEVKVEEPVTEAATIEPEVETEAPAPETEEPTPIVGVVSGCARLNIRKKPNVNGGVACVVTAGTKLTINPNNSNDRWFGVTLSDGLKGYCMKQYVTLEQ